ncbi:MAG: sulfurtransferase [Solirubrobacterales bacterium]
MKNFIDASLVYENIKDKNTVIVDCRGDLFNHEYGINEYVSGHIEGAYYMDAKDDLSSDQTIHGGRNPLPDLEKLKNKIEAMGISNDTKVVAYDDQKIATAARFCWLLRYIGHKNNHILNGGISKWIAAGYPLTKDIPDNKSGSFKIEINNDIYADMDYLKNNINTEYIIDSRTEARYLGKQEPIDFKAGHIPNAVNYYWKNFLFHDGTVIDIDKLIDFFKEIKNGENVTVYCGSGIDAAFNHMILDEIGIKSRLYIGSFSDWITYPENSIIGGN